MAENLTDASAAKLISFRIPDAKRIDIEEIVFSASYIEGNATAWLYNARTGEWDEQKSLYISQTENAQDYLNADGEIFVRLQSREGRGGSLFVEQPYLEVKGRTK